MEFLEQPSRESLVQVEVLREGCELVLYLEFADAALATPPTSSVVADAPAASVPEDDAPAVPIPANSDVLLSQFPPNNAGTFEQTSAVRSGTSPGDTAGAAA
jgi:hypothetical protein